MITAVSLNPSIDRTIRFARFEIGATNRVLDIREDASGKGVNVALSAAKLGAPVRCIGFLRQGGGAMVEDVLRRDSVPFEFVELPGSLRVNMKLFDQSTGITTEVNQSGEPVDTEDLTRVTQLVAKYAQKGEYMAFCGSMPPGCPDDFYRSLIALANNAGCLCALDADRVPLIEAARAKPFLIKPNRMELETLAGRLLQETADILTAARELIDNGVEIVLVSLSAEGALMVTHEGAWRARALEVEIRSTVGAGDAMLAGFFASYAASESPLEAFRTSMASAAACVMTEGTQPVERALVEALALRVMIKKI